MLFCGLGEHGIWSFRFSQIFPNVHLLSPEMITVICLLFFAGCTAKSAQIPLYIWLPDAMAGPTPVSALIHAATMVTSGIYMVVRSNILFSLSPTALCVIAWTGALTALLAASIGLVQNDIKKVPCLFHRKSAGLHVSGSWCRRLYSRDLSCPDPFFFQGTSIYVCRKRNSRYER